MVAVSLVLARLLGLSHCLLQVWLALGAVPAFWVVVVCAVVAVFTRLQPAGLVSTGDVGTSTADVASTGPSSVGFGGAGTASSTAFFSDDSSARSYRSVI